MLHKIYGCLIGAVIILLLFVGFGWLKAHDAWKDFQRDLAVTKEREKNNQQIEKQSIATINTADKKIAGYTAGNTAIDAETKRKLDQVSKQVSMQLNSDDVRAILQQEIPKLQVQKTKDQSGNDVLAVADTQENRDILNQADAAFKSCRFKLDDCQQKQQNFLDIIAQKDVIIAANKTALDARQDTINSLEHDLKKATSFGKGGNIWSRTGRVALPIICAGGGAWIASKGSPGAKGAAIGAVAGGSLCAFSFHF